MTMRRSSHLPPESIFRFHDKSRLLATKPCIVVGYVEISMAQQFLTHNNEREPIMTLLAQGLHTFKIKGSTCKAYSISIIPNRDPSKNSSVAHRLRNPIYL